MTRVVKNSLNRYFLIPDENTQIEQHAIAKNATAVV
jgi:hypothetical protein